MSECLESMEYLHKNAETASKKKPTMSQLHTTIIDKESIFEADDEDGSEGHRFVGLSNGDSFCLDCLIEKIVFNILEEDVKNEQPSDHN